MIKVYICPKCGWMRTVSRRKNVECFKCGEREMFQVKLTYDKYIGMSLKEREDYADSWLYIHLRNLKEQHV
ncbi:MAG: DNA-directed RNA polymerase subunit M [Eubacterium sp.]|nr:DNA-directed RNA polymerase subunit M [Eubacterium sp.]